VRGGGSTQDPAGDDGPGRVPGRVIPGRVINEAGAGPFVIICDHASRHVPREFAALGLATADLERHIAWDPGALPVARLVAAALDAPLIHSTVSRLVIDVNRDPDAPDLIPSTSEDTEIPGNRGISAAARRRRMAALHEPYHAAIDRLVSRRLAEAMQTALIGVHTFTPVFRGSSRPWHVGVLHGRDLRIAGPLLAALAAEAAIMVGDNQPYRPEDGVYYTLARHAEARGLPGAMIEIRNDMVADGRGQREWAERLCGALAALDLPARAA